MKCKIHLLRQIGSKIPQKSVDSKNPKDLIKTEQINGSYYILERTLTTNGKTDEDFIRYNKKRFGIDKTSPSYMDRKFFHFFINIDTAKKIQFKELETGMNPELLDLMVGKHIVKDLTRGLSKGDSPINILSLFIGLFIGALLGGIICTIIYTNRIYEIMDEYSGSHFIINSIKESLYYLFKVGV